MADIAVGKSASQFPRILAWGIPIVLTLLAVLAIILFLLGKGGEGAVAQATAPTAAQASAPAPAVADPRASEASKPIALADKPAEPAVPAGVLKFKSGLELYEAAIAGKVPIGTKIQVRGVLNPFGDNPRDNTIGRSAVVLHYIPPLRAEYDGSVRAALEIEGVMLPCEPPAGSLHNVTGLKSGDQITVTAEMEWLRHRGPYAAAVSLINCSIIK